MSRHIYVRRMNEDDYEDDGDDYSSSYGSDYGLSKSLEQQYMFRRDQGGHPPQFSTYMDSLGEGESEFEMDLGLGSTDGAEAEEGAAAMTTESGGQKKNLQRMVSSYDTSALSPDEMTKLISCLDYILDIVGETVPEYTVKETIVRCNYDSEKALNDLLSGSSSSSNTHPASPPKRSKLNSDQPELGGTSSQTKLITTPLVKPTFLKAKQCDFDADSNPISPKSSRANSPLPSKLETLSLKTPKKSDVLDTTTTPLKQVVMRKSDLNVCAEFKKTRGNSKESLNLIVIGHVDSGKSTLMGHLLFQLGQVSQKIMHKYEQESKKVGKQSFMYAWVLDETDEERERGITMDVGQNRFETENRIVTLLDAPGHKDFIPNMIGGAYQADVAILVVNATTGEFEAGFEAGGQTREHALLVRSLGVGQLCVAINKLDTVNWDENRFSSIRDKLKLFLTKQAGFKESDISYIPCSGLTGENLSKVPSSEKLTSWYTGLTLAGAVDILKTPIRSMEKPFRLAISDVFRAQTGSGFSVAGRVEAGVVMKDDKVFICPLNEVGTVKSVDCGTGFAGDHVTLTLAGPDQASVTGGMVVCDPSSPVPVTSRFLARIVIFNIEMPITKGYPVIVHYGSVSEQGNIKKLISLLNKSSGEVVKSKPRCLTGNQSAVVELVLSRPVPLELYKDNRELGRFMLRSGGNTLAAGIVTQIL